MFSFTECWAFLTFTMSGAARSRIRLAACVVPRAAALAVALSATTACLTSLTPGPPAAPDKTLPAANASALEDLAIAQMREIVRLQPTNDRRRGMQSMVAKGGKLYLSISATEDWMATMATSDCASTLVRSFNNHLRS